MQVEDFIDRERFKQGGAECAQCCLVVAMSLKLSWRPEEYRNKIDALSKQLGERSPYNLEKLRDVLGLDEYKVESKISKTSQFLDELKERSEDVSLGIARLEWDHCIKNKSNLNLNANNSNNSFFDGQHYVLVYKYNLGLNKVRFWDPSFGYGARGGNGSSLWEMDREEFLFRNEKSDRNSSCILVL